MEQKQEQNSLLSSVIEKKALFYSWKDSFISSLQLQLR